MASVDFHSGLTGSDFRGNLLIQHSRNHESHNFPLSRSQRLITVPQTVDFRLLFARGAIPLEGLLNCV